jgi:hypothetical protein
VFAYEKKTPTEGGAILHLDGRPVSTTLNGKGALVVGVHSRGAAVLDAVGLVYKAE